MFRGNIRGRFWFSNNLQVALVGEVEHHEDQLPGVLRGHGGRLELAESEEDGVAAAGVVTSQREEQARPQHSLHLGIAGVHVTKPVRQQGPEDKRHTIICNCKQHLTLRSLKLPHLAVKNMSSLSLVDATE